MAKIAASESMQPFDQKKRLRALQIAAVPLALAVLLSGPRLTDATVHEFIELSGLALIFACLLGRLWSILYVGTRKNCELVTAGPYSMTRNPLYLFSTIGALGVGLAFGSLILGVALFVASYAVFRFTALKEADYLRSAFGASYDAYARVTPMFWPNPLLYRPGTRTEFSPAALKRTFLDGLYFLALFPVLELVEYLHESGVVPTLFTLY